MTNERSSPPSAIVPNIRWVWWMCAILAAFFFLYAIRAILLPFMVGLAIAYLLDPLADRLEARSVPRGMAAALVLIVFLLLIVGVFCLLAPILSSQIKGIIHAFPSYVRDVQPVVLKFLKQAGGVEKANDVLSSASGKVMTILYDQAVNVLAEGVAIFNTLSLLIISPVVAFYLLRDWDHLIAEIDTLLPQRVAPTIRRLALESDRALSGFVRGQGLLCLCIGFLYALGWSLLGLQYGIVLGFLVGILAFIPVAGQAFGLLIAMVIAVGQWGTAEPWKIAGVMGVFLAAQAIETTVLTPKLVGEQIGLHAVWVLFAVFAGAELMGMVGVFIAVPVAAVVAVLGRYAVETYRNSIYFSQ